MSQAYSDSSRKVKVFYVSDQLKGEDTLASHAAGIEPSWRKFDNGWYYWFCFPGCLPDSDPVGPFGTEAEAFADAQRGDA